MVATSPLDDVEFLARSAHRVEVLDRFREGPWTRPDLHDATGISQPTLGRVLGSLQDRNWVERRGRQYALTAFGEIVADEFADRLETMATIDRLREVMPLLPTDELDFEVRRLADARVTTPGAGDPFRHVRRVEDLVYGADHLRLLSNTVAPGTAEDHAELMEDFQRGDQEVESVITTSALKQSLGDQRVLEWFRASVDLDRIKLYRYDGVIPFMLGVADGAVFLVPTDGSGIPAAVIESDDDAVRAWAEATIDRYIEASNRLRIEDLPG